MKFEITKNEMNAVFALIPAYKADFDLAELQKDMDKAERECRTVSTPSYQLSFIDGNFVIELREEMVIDSVNMCHRIIHPVFGDLKAAYRLLKGAVEAIVEKAKVECKKFNEKYAVKYRYDLYTADDPEDNQFRVIYGVQVPLNAFGCKNRIVHTGHRTELDWDFRKEPYKFSANAELIGSYNTQEELDKAGEKISIYKG